MRAICFAAATLFALVVPVAAAAGTASQAKYALKHPTSSVLHGTKTGDGGCVFRPPPLSLGARQRAVARHTVSTDFATCSQTVETGMPMHITDVYAADQGTSQQARTLETTPPPPVVEDPGPGGGGGTSSGYYYAHWEDFVDADVTKVRPSITWTWNQACATMVNASAYWWWLSDTGWYKYDPWSSWSTDNSGCNYVQVHENADYINSVFPCETTDYDNIYSNARVIGWYTGRLVGDMDYTLMYGEGCPSLHWHDELVRTSG